MPDEKQKIKRKLQATYIDVTPKGESPTYELLGLNVNEATVNYNPQSTTEQDIISDTAATEITGYQPAMPITQHATKNDPAYEFVNDLRRKRAVLADSYTTVILVDLYDEVKEVEELKGYKAERQKVSVQIDSYGGAGSDPLSISYTLNFRGDGEDGTFNVTTKEFTPDTAQA